MLLDGSCPAWIAAQENMRCCAGAELTVKQLLDRVRQAVQGAFANSELPSDQQVRAAGFAPEEERCIMPTFFALHDASFFLPPPLTGLQVCPPTHPPATHLELNSQRLSSGYLWISAWLLTSGILVHAACSTHQHTSVLRRDLGVAQVSRIDLPPEATDRVFGNSMLEMELLHLGGQLSGTLAYNIGLFKESTAERVASQYQVRAAHSVWCARTAAV